MDELSPLDRCEPIRVLFIAFCVAVTAVAFYPVAARGDTASSAGSCGRTIVCYGDSLTFGVNGTPQVKPLLNNYQNGYVYGQTVNASYPYFLAKSLRGAGYSVVNVSRGGLKAANILAMQGSATFTITQSVTFPANSTAPVEFGVRSRARAAT